VFRVRSSHYLSYGCVHIREIWEAFLDLVFPPKCPVCDAPLDSIDEELPGRTYRLCPSCLSGIVRIRHPFCQLCGMPFKSEAVSDHLCGECLTSKRYFVRARSLCVYGGTLLEAIHLFKYNGNFHLALPLGQMLADSVEKLLGIDSVDILLPVPLHTRRLKERGFNQAVLLAKPLSKRYNIPLVTSVLKRSRWTAPQVNLDRRVRRKNVRGSFMVSNSSFLSGKNILLLDDVYTTGATINECGKTLLRAGAKEVYVLTLARSVQV
jgi:ComF family protein